MRPVVGDHKLCSLSWITVCYFGASAYLVVTLQQLWLLIFSIANISSNWNLADPQKAASTVMAACFLAMYIFFSLMISYSMFHGIQKKSAQILGGAAIVFLVTEVSEMTVRILYWCPLSTKLVLQRKNATAIVDDSHSISEAEHIAQFVVKSIGVILLTVILVLYSKRLRLEERKLRVTHSKSRLQS